MNVSQRWCQTCRTLQTIKKSERYTRLSIKCVNTTAGGKNTNKGKYITKVQRNTKTRNERRKKSSDKSVSYQKTTEEKFIKNLSDNNLTDAQTKLISKGLKFIPVNKVHKNKIRRQLLQDFQHFARRMHLKYIFQGQNKEVHPFYVKSNWKPPVQKSVALESYLEDVKRVSTIGPGRRW